MSELQNFQDRMSGAILTGAFERLQNDVTARTAPRLSVYRNNSFISLTEALKATFPVTAELGDPRFFDYTAHHFIAAHPPREPQLAQYGADFPGFLARFPASRDTPLLSAMAGLEWALQSALTAPEEAPLPVAELDRIRAAGTQARLRLQPSLRFSLSRWPLLDLWAFHRKDGKMPAIPLERQLSRVAVLRQAGGITFLKMPAHRYAFWKALAGGLSLELAAARGIAREPLFDLIEEILVLARSGAITGVDAPQTIH